MTFKIHRMLIGSCLVALGITTVIFSQPAEKYHLRLTPFKSPKDSLTLLIELRFWQEFREQVEKSEAVQIVGGWDQIVELLEYAEETQRAPAIFDTSTIPNPKMIAPNAHVQGAIRKLRPGEVEVDIQILQIRTGKQIATEHITIPISSDPFKDATTPMLRRFILKLMEPIDPKLKKQKAWLGEPFDPEKINILVADFTNTGGEVDQRSEDVTSATFNKLDKFMKDDPALGEVVEVKRLSSKGSGLVIREETRAKEIGAELNADMVIWGQNLCVGDSICVFAKALINHKARTAAIAEEGVLHQYQLLRADLPMLIGAKANVLVKFIIGWTYLNDYRRQQFKQALKYLQQALTETDADDRPSILRWAAYATIDAGQYELGITWYAELERWQKEADDRAGLARTYNNIGKIYDGKGEWNKALEYYGRSEKLCIEIGDRKGLADAYNNIGLIYGKKDEWGKALEFFSKSEKLRIEIGDRADLAATYNNIGLIYSNKGEWDIAQEYYGKSEKIHIEVGDRAKLARTYNNIGSIYYMKREWDKALEFYSKSQKIHIEVGNRAGLSEAYNNIGLIYYQKGEWDIGLEYYHKDEAISIEVGDRAGLARTYNNIGLIYFNKGEWDKALEYYDKSEKISIEVGDRACLAATHCNIAEVLSEQKRYKEAVTHLEHCVEIKRQLNHPDLESDRQELLKMQLRVYSASGTRYKMLDQFWVSWNDRQKGDLFQQIDDWPRATAYYRNYLRKTQDSLPLADQAQIQNLIGIGYIKQSKGDSALPFLQTALVGFQKVNDQEMVGTVYNNLGSAHKARQNWPEALMWLRQSATHNRAVAGDSASVLGFTYYHLAEVFLHTHQPDSARYYVDKSLLLRQALGEAENVKQTRELRERILPAVPKSSKK